MTDRLMRALVVFVLVAGSWAFMYLLIVFAVEVFG